MQTLDLFPFSPLAGRRLWIGFCVVAAALGRHSRAVTRPRASVVARSAFSLTAVLRDVATCERGLGDGPTSRERRPRAAAATQMRIRGAVTGCADKGREKYRLAEAVAKTEAEERAPRRVFSLGSGPRKRSPCLHFFGDIR